MPTSCLLCCLASAAGFGGWPTPLGVRALAQGGNTDKAMARSSMAGICRLGPAVINDVPRVLCLHKFCTSLQRTCCATEWQSQTTASPTRLQTQSANVFVFAYFCSWAVVHEALLRGQTSRLRPRRAGLCGRCRAAPSDVGFVEVTQAPFPLYLDAARDALQHTPPYV